MDLARKFWHSLTRRERWKIAILAVAVVLMVGLEVVNVSAIIPFLTMAGDPATIHQNAYLSFVYQRLGFKDETQFLIFSGLIVFFLMLISNGWIALTTWLQARFVWSWNHTLSTRLLRQYLYQPYAFFLTRNTSDLTKNILSEVQQISSSLMEPAIQGLARGLVAVGIVSTLFVVEPFLALLVTTVVGGIYAVIYRFSRQTLRRIGAARLEANSARFTIASEALEGIKDVKLLGKEEAFLKRFRRSSARFSACQANSQVIGSVPRYAVEPLAFGTVILIVLYLIATRGNLAAVIPALGLYAFAGYRLMPAVQQAFKGLTQWRFYGPALENLLQEMIEGPKPQTTLGVASLRVNETIGPVTLGRALELRNVTFRYPASETDAVCDLSLTIPARATIGLVGATGSGKTTLVDLILGLLRPQSGEILADGTPITEWNLRLWQDQLGYVPQNIFLTDASVAENIAFGVPREEIDMAAVREAARIAMIDEFVTKELPLGYDTIVGERGIRLSGGQRQRIGIARALYRNPSVLVFDEATSALDNRTEEAVMEAIRALLGQKTTIMVAHRLTTLRDCDRIYMLDRGRLVASGTYEELMAGVGRFGDLAHSR